MLMIFLALVASTAMAQDADTLVPEENRSLPAPTNEEGEEVDPSEGTATADETLESPEEELVHEDVDSNEQPEEDPNALPEDPPVEELSADELAEIEASLMQDLSEEPTAPTPTRAIPPGLQSMNPDISLILNAALAWFSDEPMQTGAHDPNKTGFTFQQGELALEAAVDPYFEMKAYIVFAQFGVEVEELFASTLALPYSLRVRAGQFLHRFGRINATHPHAWHFLDQPVLLGKFFGGENSRGLGLEVSWLSPLPWYAELVGAVGDAAGGCCARSFYGNTDLGVEGPGDFLYTTALKQFFAVGRDVSILWGLSGQFGPNPTGQGNRSEIYGTDLYLRYRPATSPNRRSVSLQTEAMLRRRQVPGDVLVDYGLYSQLIWQLALRWETGARYEWVGGLANDPLDEEWDQPRERIALQGTFYPSHFSRLRLQLARDHAKYREAPVYAVMLGIETLIGAHGAHAY